jgi:hypothetical protein
VSDFTGVVNDSLIKREKERRKRGNQRERSKKRDFKGVERMSA